MDYQLAIAYACGMKPLLNVLTAKNLLVGAGACYLSGWLALPLEIGFGKLTQGAIYRGDFAGAVVMPLVVHLPEALVATEGVPPPTPTTGIEPSRSALDCLCGGSP